MRTLLLLRGAPGSGKSTWIKENKLEQYTLEADLFRNLISNPILGLDGNFKITQANDNTAWGLLFEALETRMKRGDFTIIDATHSNENMFVKYKGLLDKYRYRAYYKEFDVELDELLHRNKTRPKHKQIPDNEIHRAHALIKHTQPQTFIKKIDDITEIINYWTEDLTDKYDNIKIIGDIHGSYSVLKEAIGTKLDDKIKYIFTGDLLDRGIQNKEVLDFILTIHKKPNVVFIEGNHDAHLRNWSLDSWELSKKGTPIKPREFIYHTLPQILGQKEKSEFKIGILDDKYYTINGKNTKIPIWTMTDENNEKLIIEQPYLKYKNNTLWLKPQKYSKTEIDTDVKVITVDEEKLKSKVRELTRRFRLAYAFEFHGNKYFVNHSGISSLPQMTTISGTELIFGVGTYDDQIDEIWEENYKQGKTQGYIQVHGHRKTNSTEHSISLEDVVEYGGNLVVLDINKNSYERKLYKNEVYKLPTENSSSTRKTWIEDTENKLTNILIHDKYIKAKLLDNTLMSLNFTKSAFKKKKWNDKTITARGLFVDTTTGDIRIRSYNKFFNLHENKNTSPKTLAKTLKFPIKAYDKYNGFLGIASTVNGEFTLATKSTTTGEYVDYFKEIYNNLTDDEKEQLQILSKKYNCSFTFEVLHTDDRHIIDFSENRLIILDAVKNEYDIHGKNIDPIFSKQVLDELTITSTFFSKKELVSTFNNLNELLNYVKEHTNDRTTEGLVIEDQSGFMFKVKYDYYTELKRFRGLRDMVKANYHSRHVTQFGRNAKDVAFISWCKKQPLEKLTQTHIIELFKEFELI